MTRYRLRVVKLVARHGYAYEIMSGVDRLHVTAGAHTRLGAWWAGRRELRAVRRAHRDIERGR